MSLLDSILDSQLDDLNDLPEFLVPPPGAYRATILSATEKKVGDHPAVEFKFKLLETMELTNTDDTPVADGTETSIAYMLDNEYGVGNFKKFLAPIALATGASQAREVMAASVGLEVLLVTKLRVVKAKVVGEEDRKYFDVSKVEVI